MATPTPTAASYLARYPEFASAPAALVAQALAMGARRTNAEVFQSPELAEDAACLRATLWLIKSPFARKMRNDIGSDQIQIWRDELRDLQRSATMGLRVF